MTTYYLDNSAANANDGNAGTSANAPFRTLAALNRAFQPGDVINIKAGTTYSGTLTITADGTASAPVTFTKYGEGADPVINAGGAYSGIRMQGANYVAVDDLAVTNAKGGGVLVDGASGHNTLRDMEVTNSGFGYEISGHDNLFYGNYVHDLRMIVNTQGGDDDYGAAAFFIAGSNNEFAHNKVLNARAPSYDYGYDGGGFEFWNGSSNTKIHDNWVENAVGFVEAGGQGQTLSGVQIYNNVSYNNGGFHYLHNTTGATNFGMTISGFTVSHNTIVEPTRTGGIVSFSGPVQSGSYSFTDNIVYAPNATQVFNQTGSFHTDNFYQVKTAPTGSGEVSGSVNFVKMPGDFHLQAGSAAAGYGAYVDGHEPGLPGTSSSPTPSPSPSPTPPPSGTGTSYGSGSDSLVLKISQDAYNGNAQYTVSVDGKQIGGTLTASASHALGQSDTVTFKGDWGPGTHTVTVNFLNDAWGGTAATDRNLYVTGATYDGAPVSGANLSLFRSGPASFQVSDTTALPSATLNVVNGTPGNDAWLVGTAGDDIITAGKGHDAINGAGGHDVFVFAKGDGWDWIYDFTRGSDKLQMVGMTQADISWHAATWNGVGSGLQVDYNHGANGGVFLPNVTTLSWSDFTFA